MVLPRALVWLSRCFHSRGFGVQSPSDYRFVRYVINEHYPYYAYEELRNIYPDASWKEQKIGRMLFRIANFVQPQSVVVVNQMPCPYHVYIQKGCNNSSIYNNVQDLKHIDMFVFNAVNCTQDELDNYFSLMHEYSVMIVEGIYDNNKTKALWNKVKDNNNAVVTFDLYYAGVVMFDKKRYRQHYKINF